jgi:hypothetical protein
MTRSLRHTLVGIALLATIGCGESPVTPTSGNGAQGRAYLEQMIAIMEANSINRLTIDWNAFRQTVLAQVSTTASIADTDAAILTALQLLGDGHSGYIAVSGTTISAPTHRCTPANLSAPPLPATIGYVKVGGFSGLGAAATTFADGIQNAIRSADRDDVIGWIVDTRGNTGGNMWPMIAGVGPILGEGVAGYFIDPTGRETSWEYRDGASWVGSAVAQRVTAAYTVRRELPRVAVLTDNAVASSGEATVIAFRQRRGTRSFGAGTCGLSTANSTFTLSDGATLVLTTAVLADRTHAPYGRSVEPDEPTLNADAFDRAVTWLLNGG